MNETFRIQDYHYNRFLFSEKERELLAKYDLHKNRIDLEIKSYQLERTDATRKTTHRSV